MKKIRKSGQNFVITSTLIAAGFLAQSCGSSTGNVSAVTATTQTGTSCVTTDSCGTTVGGGTVYNSCAQYGGTTTTVTSGGVNVSVCRYIVGQVSWLYFDIVPAAEMTIVNSGISTGSSGGSGTLTASGGTITNLQLSQGDKFEFIASGHYSPSGGDCHTNNGGGDISVLGNSDGKDPNTNSSNGENVGLWIAFENSSGQYSSPVNATTQAGVGSGYQSIQVPMGSTTNNLVLGYNWNGTIGCGDMGGYYTIIRCIDASGNTYTCN